MEGTSNVVLERVRGNGIKLKALLVEINHFKGDVK